MTERVAVFITNYNMPERADALADFIERKAEWDVDVYVIDNGSDIEEPATHTNVWVKPNAQTTGGWLAGLREAKRQDKYFAYVFAITSADFPETTGDPIAPLVELLQQNSNAVGVHPALTSDSTTSWTHLITRGGTEPRQTFMIDNIFSMYRADWFDSIGWFDPTMRYAWGIDLETCYLARRAGLELYVHEGVQIRKITNIGYTMGRMNMTTSERERLAGQSMEIVLHQKYGADWWNLMTNAYVESEWR